MRKIRLLAINAKIFMQLYQKIVICFKLKTVRLIQWKILASKINYNAKNAMIYIIETCHHLLALNAKFFNA